MTEPTKEAIRALKDTLQEAANGKVSEKRNALGIYFEIAGCGYDTGWEIRVRAEPLLNLLNTFAAQRVAEEHERTIERCELAAYHAKLPPDFQWGEEARDNFDFGKEQAGRAICALKEPRR